MRKTTKGLALAACAALAAAAAAQAAPAQAPAARQRQQVTITQNSVQSSVQAGQQLSSSEVSWIQQKALQYGNAQQDIDKALYVYWLSGGKNRAALDNLDGEIRFTHSVGTLAEQEPAPLPTGGAKALHTNVVNGLAGGNEWHEHWLQADQYGIFGIHLASLKVTLRWHDNRWEVDSPTWHAVATGYQNDLTAVDQAWYYACYVKDVAAPGFKKFGFSPHGGYAIWVGGFFGEAGGGSNPTTCRNSVNLPPRRALTIAEVGYADNAHDKDSFCAGATRVNLETGASSWVKENFCYEF